MEKRQLSYHMFPNYGYILVKLLDEELKPIIDEVKEIQKDFNKGTKHNSELAGNLQYEFTLEKCKPHLLRLLKPMVDIYDQETNYFNYDINFKYLQHKELRLENLWVNFMKKYEFNPPHIHGGLFSFVLWLDMPYNIKDELEQASSKNSNYACPGSFLFQYTNCLGGINTLDLQIDKEWNGTLCLFPSKMVHSVTPFYTSDDYRISVSGNLERVI